MKDLRKAAQGRPCQMRLPGVCNHDPETTVLAHIRRGGIAGMGQKPTDLAAVVCCSSCHDAIDRRNNMGGYTKSDLDGYILEALCRTLAYWEKEGLL